MIASYVKRNATETWIETKGFISKNEYYQFNTVLQAHLDALESEDFCFDVDRLISADAKKEGI